MKKTIAMLALVAVVAAASAVFYWVKPSIRIQKEYVSVPEIKEVVKIKRVMVPVKEIEVIEKEKIIEVLKYLPAEITSDPDKQITATAVIPAYKGDTNVIAVTDLKTGRTTLKASHAPLPFMAFENDKEIGVRYGIDTAQGRRIDIFGRWTFARVGNVHASGYAELNSKPEGKAMLELSYKF